MKTIKKGGDLLGKGAYGCVFNVEFPCRNKKRTQKKKGKRKYISKVFFHKYAVRDAQEEYIMNRRIRKIKGYWRWCVLWDKICKPIKFQKLKIIDKKIKDCLKSGNLTPKQFNEKSSMLIGEYGGSSLEKVFSRKMKTLHSKKTFISFFLKTMRRIFPLFVGINQLKLNGISHLDIKRGNIVLDISTFKLIDFGLACKINDNNEIKRRSQRQFYDNRIYTPYPIDFVYAYTNKSQESLDMRSYIKDETKRNFTEYNDIHKHFFKRENVKQNIIDFLKNVSVNKKHTIETMDVYSLGYLIPKAIYSDLYLSKLTMKDIVEYIQAPQIKPFIALFKDMTRETFFNEGDRITSSEALNRFKNLILSIRK
tara:strand:- start:806 stop:1903 length:1098 start_codon:yes stop_codon:yes gene_type:complete